MVVWLNFYKLTGLTDVVTCQVKAQMEALNEQMQRPEVQEQMKEVQSLMQDKDFDAGCVQTILLLAHIHPPWRHAMMAAATGQYHTFCLQRADAMPQHLTDSKFKWQVLNLAFTSDNTGGSRAKALIWASQKRSSISSNKDADRSWTDSESYG